MVRKVAIVRGGFDPIHPGHIDLIQSASDICDGGVIVLLNSDQWLVRKKGKSFMDWASRAKILRAIENVLDCIPVDDGDGTVCNGIYRLKNSHPDTDFVFCKGGDYKPVSSPETALCEGLGIPVQWGCGGGKIASSSDLLANWSGDNSDTMIKIMKTKKEAHQ